MRDAGSHAEEETDELGWAIELIDPVRDLEAVQAINRDAFARAQGDLFTRELKKYPLSRIYVIRTKPEMTVGFSVVWVISGNLYINNFAIARRWRRRGAGRALIAWIMNEAKRFGVQRATLEVRASNAAARRLYEAAGFRVTNVRPKYYSRPVEDALILWRDLESTHTL